MKKHILEDLAKEIESIVSPTNSAELIIQYMGESAIGGTEHMAKFNYNFLGQEYSKMVPYEGETGNELIHLGINQLDYLLGELINTRILSTNKESAKLEVYHELDELLDADDTIRKNENAISFYKRCQEKDIIPTDFEDRHLYEIGLELS